MTKERLLRFLLLALAIVSLTVLIFRRDLDPADDPDVPYPATDVSVDVREGGVRIVDARAPVMGTRFILEVAAPDEATARRACGAAYARIAELEQAMSTWIESSVLSRVNREAARHPVEVDAYTFEVLRRSAEYHRLSGGAFDPSVGPLVKLWRSQKRLGRLPTEEEVLAARALVGFDRVALNESALSVRFPVEGMALDVGGIAKGYSADEAARAALDAGAVACRVNAGGDQVVRGAPPWSPAGFEVAVRDPDGGEADSLPGRTFHILDGAVATSGNYERFTEMGGQRYSHIMDPRTGRPVADAIVQVTVVGATGVETDALATALTVLGEHEGLLLAESLPGLQACFLIRDGESLRSIETSGFPGTKR